MEHLMAVEIAENSQELTDQFIGILLILEILRIVSEPLRKGLSIHILHHDFIIIKRDIAHQVRMLQSIARLKFLAKCLLIADVSSVFRFQPFQEMQLAIELHTEGITGGSLCVQLFDGVKSWLVI